MIAAVEPNTLSSISPGTGTYENTNPVGGGYKPEEEELLRECADKAQCYRIMHTWDYNDYRIQAMWFTIPVIILSTLTGTANFAQSSFPDEVIDYAPMMIGSINIVAGIVTTISQFLRVNELQEGHRVASLSWGKYSRNLKYELSRHPRDRTPITEMMKISKQEFDRLMETSPPITEKTINKFTNKFKDREDIIKPEICDGLQQTKIYDSNQDRIIEKQASVMSKAASSLVGLSSISPPMSGEVVKPSGTAHEASDGDWRRRAFRNKSSGHRGGFRKPPHTVHNTDTGMELTAISESNTSNYKEVAHTSIDIPMTDSHADAEEQPFNDMD